MLARQPHTQPTFGSPWCVLSLLIKPRLRAITTKHAVSCLASALHTDWHHAWHESHVGMDCTGALRMQCSTCCTATPARATLRSRYTAVAAVELSLHCVAMELLLELCACRVTVAQHEPMRDSCQAVLQYSCKAVARLCGTEVARAGEDGTRQHEDERGEVTNAWKGACSSRCMLPSIASAHKQLSANRRTKKPVSNHTNKTTQPIDN